MVANDMLIDAFVRNERIDRSNWKYWLRKSYNYETLRGVYNVPRLSRYVGRGGFYGDQIETRRESLRAVNFEDV